MTVVRMTDLRRCQVILLDERVLEFPLQPRLMTTDLLDIAASHFSLREKEYFGLCYENDGGQQNWLRADKKVVDHDLPRKISPVVFTFTVRLYVSSITLLKETKTIELFYLHARNLIYKGDLECDSETIFLLGAYVLQATHGDFISESIARSDLKKLPVLPMRVLKEHPSLSFCESRAIAHYKRMTGIFRGEAIVNYLSIVERLPMYGVHYYDVKDKGQIPWRLGLSHRGIGQYDFQDKKVPRKLHQWSQMENLYYRDKKFSVEIRGGNRAQSIQNVSRLGTLRRSLKPDVTVISWYTTTQALARGMWLMAVAQHQFYLDKKITEKILRQRTLKEIAKDLSRSSSSLASSMASDFSDTASFYYSVDGEEDNGTACADMISALQARKDNLEERLQQKLEELRQLCLREAEITGALPGDTPDLGDEFDAPFRRTVGTSFEFSETVLSSATNAEEQEILDLQRDYEIQKQITSAAQRLAGDPNQSKKVRKTRRNTYQKSMIKLKTMEQQLAYMKRQVEYERITFESVNGSGNGTKTPSGTLSDDCLDSDSLGPFDSECSSHCSRESTPQLKRPSYLSLNSNNSGFNVSPASSSMSLDSSKPLDNRSLCSLPIPSRSPHRSLSVGLGPNRKASAGSMRIKPNFISTSEEMLDAIDHSKANGHAQFLVGEFGNSGIYSAMATPRRTALKSCSGVPLSASLNRLPPSHLPGRSMSGVADSQPNMFFSPRERRKTTSDQDRSSSLNDLLSTDYPWADTVAEETLV